MKRINIVDEQTSNKIAAGEVVECRACVVFVFVVLGCVFFNKY